MYRLLLFLDHTWHIHQTTYDCLEDALVAVHEATRNLPATPTPCPWRVQEWIDIRTTPVEAGFWRDARYWADGEEYGFDAERIS